MSRKPEPDSADTLGRHFSGSMFMRIALKWITSIVLALCVIVCAGGLLVLHIVRHRVESHAPHLIADNSPEVDFVFHTLDGKDAKLSDYKGKAVFLDLWGTWCLQCVAEMPTVQKLYDHYRSDPKVVFLIVSRMDTPQAVERFARRGGYHLPFYVTRDEDVPASMYLQQYPATFLYTPGGTLAAHHAGGADWSDESVIRFIDDLKSR
jgi:thiol-disulfide isomerase/thioredoxin